MRFSVFAIVLFSSALVSHAILSPVGDQSNHGLGQTIAIDDRVSEQDSYGCCGGDRYAGLPFGSRSAVIAKNGIAATSHPLATQVALDILKGGGNAIEAAIAANAAIGLMEPTGSGIGGDLFAIVWDAKQKKLHGLNSSGRAPLGQTLDQLKQRLGNELYIPKFGCLSVSVPGAVDGWFELHSKFSSGRFAMKDLLQPAIKYADEGFPVTEVISSLWKRNVENLLKYDGVIEELDNMLLTYTRNGTTPETGDVFRNPDLARTLRAIAEQGKDAFYNGTLSDVMDRYFRRINCPLRKVDLQSHRSTWDSPVSVNYRGYDVWELPPNGQGIAALQMLNILEGFDLRSMGFNSPEYLHVHVEAKKLAFEDRARFYADPSFSDVPIEFLLSKDYAAQRRALIDLSKAADTYPPGDPRLERSDTIYMTVADSQGNMISLIQSNYRGMGSGLVPDGLGFMLQNRGEMFNLDPLHPNVYAPGKRPFHTIIPAFITRDGKPILSFGVMGGGMQPQGHAQIVCNIIDFGMNVQEAGDAARYYHDGSSEPTGQKMTTGGTVSLEQGVDDAVRKDLASRGHVLVDSPGDFGGYQAIMFDEKKGVYFGASEFRKDGQAAGY